MKRISLLLITLLLVLAGCGQKNIMKEYKISDHNFETKKFSEIVQDLEDKVPGVYYIGYPECPWCMYLVPHLNDALKEHDLTAMYLNPQEPEFKNNVALAERFNAFRLSFPDGVANEGSVPFVIVIAKDGSVQGHSGTAPSHDARTNDMTDMEIEYLQARLDRLLSTLK